MTIARERSPFFQYALPNVFSATATPSLLPIQFHHGAVELSRDHEDDPPNDQGIGRIILKVLPHGGPVQAIAQYPRAIGVGEEITLPDNLPKSQHAHGIGHARIVPYATQAVDFVGVGADVSH